jgi:hypothetical protein
VEIRRIARGWWVDAETKGFHETEGIGWAESRADSVAAIWRVRLMA